MTVLAAWQPATAYAKGATVRPVLSPSSVPVALVNGDFEDGDTDWTKDAGWAISAGSAYEGTYKAIFTGAGSGTIETSGTYPATAGQVINATVKAKVLDEDDGATAVLLWYNASNVLIETSTGLESSVETGVWMQLEVTGTGPDGAAYVTFAVEATRTTGASVTIDDARWDYTAPLGARRVGYRAVQELPGVSGAVEPTWPTTLGERVNDGTVVWEAVELSYIEWTAHPILESGLTEPNWPTTVGAFVRDGTINWECVSRRVEDENCPNTPVVAIINSKVFAADRDIVRFCATANPLDWTSEQDAGYLPTGLQQANANDMAVLYPYRGNLACWNANCFQMWQTDPDPSQMALLDQMDGIGSTHPLAARAVGNDLYFLAAQGVRSIGIANAAQNMQAGDVGMPIDVLVQAAMVQAAIDGKKALSTYWPGMGQYWLCFGDDGVTAGAGGALALACPTNISAIVGEAYSYTYVATGGTAPYTFSVVSGTLPPGLTLNSTTGVLSGTLTTAGSYSFGVKVTDAIGVEAFCGWAAEVLEDVAEIEQNIILVTGSAKPTFTEVWCSAPASQTPTFSALSTASGASIAAGIGAYRPGVGWAAVGTDTSRYGADVAAWTTNAITTDGFAPVHFSNGPGGALAVYEVASSALKHFKYSSAGTFTTFNPTGTYSNAASTPYIDHTAMDYWFSTESYWFCCHDRELYRATAPEGPYVAVRDEYVNTSEGLNNNGAVVVGFPGGVEHDGWLYLACEFHFDAGQRRAQIRRSPDGGETIPDAQILYNVAIATANVQPIQGVSCGEDVVFLCSDLSVLTSANNFATPIATGLSGSLSMNANGRQIAANGVWIYVVSGDKCVVTADGGLTWGSPITLPIASAVSISIGAPPVTP